MDNSYISYILATYVSSVLSMQVFIFRVCICESDYCN